MRATYQVLIFPYRFVGEKIEYAILKRSDMNVWQGAAGGGEDGEDKFITVKREGFEELGLKLETKYLELDSTASIPGCHFSEYKKGWGNDIYVVTEYSFGVLIEEQKLKLSHEHTEIKWCSYEEASNLLEWDSNRTALWELNERLL